MRPALTLVKILALVTGFGCAGRPSPPGSFALPGPGTRDADLRAVRGQTGLQLEYLRDLSLPTGTAELYSVGAAGLFIYLPEENAPLVCFATLRRYASERGSELSLVERALASELWRMGLFDQRRRAIHDLGGLVHQERSGAGLVEFVALPFVGPPAALHPLFEPPKAPPERTQEALMDGALTRWDTPESDVERARTRAAELSEGGAYEDVRLEFGALSATDANLSKLRRDEEADLAMLSGAIGRQDALRIAARWLASARARAAAPAGEGVPPSEPATLTAGPRRYLVRFPIPEPARTGALGELAPEALANAWARRAAERGEKPKGGALALLELHLDRREPTPALDLLVELPPTISATTAPVRLERELDELLRARFSREERQALTAAAELRRRASLEGPRPLFTTLLFAAEGSQLDALLRPVPTPRPGALTGWLSSVLRKERAIWVAVEPEGREAP